MGTFSKFSKKKFRTTLKRKVFSKGMSKTLKNAVSAIIPSSFLKGTGTYTSILGFGPKHKTPFPANKIYKLTYNEDFSVSVGTAGTIGTLKVFNLNSIYDPDRSGGGHQPYGYDALAIAYTRYKVFGCKVNLKFYNAQTVETVTVAMALMSPSEVGAGATIAGIVTNKVGERPNGQLINLQQSVGPGQVTRNIKIPIYKAFNMTKLQYNADIDGSTSAIGSDPGSVTTLQIGLADPNGGSSGACRCNITLEYTVQLYQVANMAQS